MSEIHVSCIDQVLKLTETPIIASGGLNETKVVFTFCEKWDGFVKTALFYVDADKKYSVVLDENDICIIPWEVCAENGSFYFTVFGNKGNTRRTSSIVKYKVGKGVVVDETFPSDPTPEVYDQIAAMLAENRRFTEDFIASSGASIEAAKAAQEAADRCDAAAEEAMGVVGSAVMRVKENNTGNFFGFWIGTQEQYDAIENKERNRLYLISGDITTPQAVESPVFPGCYYRVVDGETEWVNPPMIRGAEYRTTERYDGKVVYCKHISYESTTDFGGTGVNEASVPHGISGFDSIVRIDARHQGYHLLPIVTSGGGVASVVNVTNNNINLRFKDCTFDSRVWKFNLWYTKD